jgi:PAS domain S-box-containing protein
MSRDLGTELEPGRPDPDGRRDGKRDGRRDPDSDDRGAGGRAGQRDADSDGGGAEPARLARPAPRLSDLIRTHRGEILATWERVVRAMPVARSLDRPTLMDHIPSVLDRIADIADQIGAGATPQLADDVAEVHAIERLGEGFDLGQVVVEFNVLRDCIVRLWQDHLEDPAHLAELRALHHAIDKAVTASIDRYTKARDRTLQALDRLASAALASRSLDDFLRRLLSVLVETTSAVDTATILLRDGDLLRIRASIGLEEEVAQQVTMPIGQDFAGTIAATRRPLELRDAAADPIVLPPTLRAAGLRALYGVPLVEGHHVIAVAHMGSRTAHEFSRQDKQLFLAMANRATAAIFQHMLRERAERAAAELRARELEFRSLADNIPQLAWIGDEAGVIYWTNRRWLDYTGQTVEETRRDQGRSIQHPDHLPRVVETWERALATGAPWEATFPLRGRDGRYRWFLSRATPIRDETGAIVRWFGTNTDVTEPRFLDEATKILNQSLDYAGTLEQLARLAVPDIADWCIVDLVEPAGVRRVAIAHRDPAKVQLVEAWAHEHPLDLSEETGVAQVIRTGEPQLAAEVTDEMLAAALRDAAQLAAARALGLRSCIIAPLFAHGRTLGAITLLTSESGRRYQPSDVTVACELGRRAGMAVDNARLYAESQQARRTREEVLAIVSHDLRSPLGAIDLAATSLLGQYGTVPRSRKQLEVIRRSVDRMAHLINDLLDMATIEARGLSLSLGAHAASALLEGVVDMHAPLARERGIQILRDDQLGGARLWCDRNRVEQVFANLLENAKKYCRPGDTIVVRGAIEAGSARFSVADTGPGIAADELPHLFRPYWAAKRQSAQKGTGLGLYICKGIVEAHGGAIRAESQLGQGATFSFTIPLAPPGGAAGAAG